MAIPSGTVTFLFTDIEGSTRLWEEHQHSMQEALKRHDTILRTSIESHGGYVFKTVGDAFCAAFPTATDALASAIEIQEQVEKELWGETPIRIRMSLHTGTAEERDGDYFGRTVNRVARLEAAGHGGQVLVSSATQELLADNLPEDVELKDLGVRRLKDLERPEHIFQVQTAGGAGEFPQLKTLDIRPNNLPVQVTSFVGREREIQEIRDLLKPARMLTIAGPGGIGKTRISLHATAELLDAFHDGVWFVDLVPVSGEDEVWQAIASPLGIHAESGIPLAKTVPDRLADKEMLVILDNCEHLVEAAAKTAETLLALCPKVKVLATSREALGIAGETLYQIQPLSVPDAETADGKVNAEDLSEYESVRLFIDRALQIKQDFTVSNENAPALAQICRWLDGIPLAIELAASRVKLFSLPELHKRLGDRFKVLNKGLRTAPPRQQTLRALIDWSYNLLEDDERDLFTCLSVFSGGWTLEAAETVCGSSGPLPLNALPPWRDWMDPEHNYRPESGADVLFKMSDTTLRDMEPEVDVLDLLERLIDKSLVITDEEDGSTRFRMLETIRQYALQRLEESGQFPKTRRRHMEYYLLFLEDTIWTPYAEGKPVISDLPLPKEYSNITAALRTSLQKKEDHLYGCRFIASLFEYWQYYGMIKRGSSWVEEFQDSIHGIEDPLLRVFVCIMCGWIYQFIFDFEKTAFFFGDALQVSTQHQLIGARAMALTGLGNMWALSATNLEQAEQFLLEARDLYQNIDAERQKNVALLALATVYMYTDEYTKADELLDSVITSAADKKDMWIFHVALQYLAQLKIRQERYEEAKETAERGLESIKKYGDRGTELPARTNYLLSLIVLGELEHAAEELQKCYGLILSTENQLYFLHVKTIEGYLFTKIGKHTEALQSFITVCAATKAAPLPQSFKLTPLVFLLSLLVTLGTGNTPARIVGFIEKNATGEIGKNTPLERAAYSAVKEKLPGLLGYKKAEALMQEGATLTLEEVFDLAVEAGEYFVTG